MHMLLRTLLHLFWFAPRKSRIGVYDVGHTRFRVWPTDIDYNGHINNGVYFSIMDVARTDTIVRSGVYRVVRRRGWYPIVVAETITFRRSLDLWQRFWIETRVLGCDDKTVFLEQRFVVPDAAGVNEVYAVGYVRTRFLSRRGSITNADLFAALGVDPKPAPGWLVDWAEQTKLPMRHQPAPSVWA